MSRTLKPVFVAFLLVAVAVGPAMAATEGSPELSVYLPDNRVVAGEETSLDLFVLNKRNISSGGPAPDERAVTTARNVTVTASSGDAPITVKTATQPIGNVPEGRVGPVTFAISVDEDAAPGRYQVPVEISYNYTSSIDSNSRDRGYVTETIERDVTLVVEERARFAVINASTTAFSGETGNLRVTLENVGTETASDARVSLQSKDPALTFGGTAAATTFAGDWEPGQTKTVTVSSRFAANTRRSYAVDATVTFEDSDGVPRSSDPLQFGVTPVPGPSRFPVVNASADMAVGEGGTVEVRMRNAGNVTVQDALVTVQSKDAALQFGGTGSATTFAGSWAPGEVRTFALSARILSRADVRSYPLSLSVEYETADGETRRSAAVSTGVVPLAEQSFQLSGLSSSLAVGDEGTIRGTVTNTGETTVRNPVVMLSADNANVVPVETEHAIGDLAPGESATFEFSAEVTDAADAGPRQLSLVVRYRDAEDDVRRSDPLDVRVDIGPRTDRFAVEPVSARFAPGSGGVLELEVTNTGDDEVSDVSAKLFTDQPLSSSDDEAFIATLDAGESAVIRFALSVSGDAVERKVYPVSLDFQFEDGDGDTRLSDSYDVAVQVTATEDGDGPPIVIIGGVALALLAILGVLWYRRR
ncbi:MAG: sialidase [Halobacteriales archaeon]